MIGRLLSQVGHELGWLLLGIAIGLMLAGFEPWRQIGLALAQPWIDP